MTSIEVSLSKALSVKNWQTLVLTVTSGNTIQSLVFSGNFAEFVFGYILDLLILKGVGKTTYIVSATFRRLSPAGTNGK